MLPNFMADITTSDQRFTLQLGWIGYYDKGSYTRYMSINPWLARPDSLNNTRVQEGYVGFKGSAGNHFSYSAKVGFQQHRDLPLFVNDTLDGKTFNIVYEDKLNLFQTHAEAEYPAAASHRFNPPRFLSGSGRAYSMMVLSVGMDQLSRYRMIIRIAISIPTLASTIPSKIKIAG